MSQPVRLCVFVTMCVFVGEVLRAWGWGGDTRTHTQNALCLCTFNLKGIRGEGCSREGRGLVLIWAKG